MLEVEAVPQSCIPEVQIGVSFYICFLLVESLDLLLSNQCILVRVIPSFCFTKMCLCQVSQGVARDT
jgi:hypothetical protein